MRSTATCDVSRRLIKALAKEVLQLSCILEHALLRTKFRQVILTPAMSAGSRMGASYFYERIMCSAVCEYFFREVFFAIACT